MGVQLSSREVVRLGAATRTLLSPFDYPDLAGWCRATTDSLIALFEGEGGGFFVPVSHEPVVVTAGSYPSIDDSYLEYFHAQDTGMRRLAERGWETWNQERIYTPEELSSSEFARGFLIPNRLRSAVGMKVDVDGVKNVGVAVVHSRPGWEPFGERALVLLDAVLLPAYKAGLRAWLRRSAEREAITRLLDGLREGLLVCDLDGRVLHINSAATRLLTADPEGERLRRLATALAASLAALKRIPDSSPIAPAEQSVRTARGCYRLHGSYAGAPAFGGDPAVLVTIDRTDPHALPDEALRERFGLTRRERAVVLLLVAGRSNAEIARELFISDATARTHTQRILRKLGVASRAQIARVVLGR